MRKLKPKKQKKKENSMTALTKEEELKLELTLYLTNIAEVARKHIRVWKREIDENNGFLDINIMVLLECIVAGSIATRDKFLQDVSLVPNLSKNPIIAKCMSLCYSCFGDELPWAEEDREQRLPRGFMGTIGALARTTKALLDKKLEGIQEQLGMLKEIGAVAGLVEQYLTWVHKEITFVDLVKTRITDVDLKVHEKAILYRYNRAVLNGEYADLEKEAKQEKIEEIKKLSVEEIHMKTDKEMIKEMLTEEKEKVEKKKKGGRPKKVKEDEVVEAVEEKVEDVPVNPGHYNRFGFNTIEIIKGVMTPEGFAWSCFKDALKYLYRAEEKGGKNDYIKAREYLKWLIETPNAGQILKVGNVDEVLNNLNTNWVNISIQMAENMTGAKAILTNSILRNVHEKNFKIALEQLDILLGSDE